MLVETISQMKPTHLGGFGEASSSILLASVAHGTHPHAAKTLR